MATARKDLGGVKPRPSAASRPVGPVSRRIPEKAQTIRHLSWRGVVPRRGALDEAPDRPLVSRRAAGDGGAGWARASALTGAPHGSTSTAIPAASPPDIDTGVRDTPPNRRSIEVKAEAIERQPPAGGRRRSRQTPSHPSRGWPRRCATARVPASCGHEFGANHAGMRQGPEVAIRARVSTRQGEQDRARPSWREMLGDR